MFWFNAQCVIPFHSFCNFGRLIMNFRDLFIYAVSFRELCGDGKLEQMGIMLVFI